jgi:hypothetical protein
MYYTPYVRVSDMHAQIVPEEGIRNLEIPEGKDCQAGQPK